jgi:hypothetical protein
MGLNPEKGDLDEYGQRMNQKNRLYACLQLSDYNSYLILVRKGEELQVKKLYFTNCNTSIMPKFKLGKRYF